MAKFNRRDFLKLASLLPGAVALSSLSQTSNAQAQRAKSNVIILLFDAMSATNLSLYGYERDTTPNFKRFAERANVYHAHNSTANFTSPGTASLLTGTYPWTHRAINHSGLIERRMLDRNLFSIFNHEYARLGYSQNLWANYLLTQFSKNLETILSPAAFSTLSNIVGDKFANPAAYRAYEEFLFEDVNPPPSLIFGLASQLFFRKRYFAESALHKEYPKGLPRTANYPIYFELKNIFDGILSTLDLLQAPYVTYFHFFAPHDPYRPTKEFSEAFTDNWKPIKKPQHRLGRQISQSDLNTRRVNYDRYIANLDAEFGKLIDAFEQRGIFENSYVIVTSDHGEMFERGEQGHGAPMLYDPVIHIPLMISSPGQRTRTDVHTPTNSVDVLPTLAHLTEKKAVDWGEGVLLPELGGKYDAERSTFSMDARTNPAFAALATLGIAMRKGKYKLTHYKNLRKQNAFELYDMENDPEELVDLYPTDAIAAPLKDELLAKLDSVNQKYKK